MLPLVRETRDAMYNNLCMQETEATPQHHTATHHTAATFYTVSRYSSRHSTCDMRQCITSRLAPEERTHEPCATTHRRCMMRATSRCASASDSVQSCNGGGMVRALASPVAMAFPPA